ncbi:hypothetical protein [Streptomyces sp. NPDC046197]
MVILAGWTPHVRAAWPGSLSVAGRLAEFADPLAGMMPRAGS